MKSPPEQKWVCEPPQGAPRDQVGLSREGIPETIAISRTLHCPACVGRPGGFW